MSTDTSAAAPAMARAMDRVYARFGAAATHVSRAGVSTPCMVLVDSDLTRYGTEAVVARRTAVLQLRTTDLADAPRQGDRIVITGGRTWVVDSLQAADPFEHRVFAA